MLLGQALPDGGVPLDELFDRVRSGSRRRAFEAEEGADAWPFLLPWEEVSTEKGRSMDDSGQRSEDSQVTTSPSAQLNVPPSPHFSGFTAAKMSIRPSTSWNVSVCLFVQLSCVPGKTTLAPAPCTSRASESHSPSPCAQFMKFEPGVKPMMTSGRTSEKVQGLMAERAARVSCWV